MPVALNVWQQNAVGKPRGKRPLTDHPENINPGDAVGREIPCLSFRGSKQGPLRVTCDASRREVGLDVLRSVVVRWNLVELPTLFMKPNPGAPSDMVEILDFHPADCRDPRETVDHDRNQRSVAQPNHRRGVDRIKQLSRLVRC